VEFSGKRRVRQALIETIAASRATTRSPSSSSSSGSKGTREAKPSSAIRARRNASSSGRPRRSDARPTAKVGGDRAVAAVAEVEDRGDPALLVEEQVVEVEVSVHHLRPQAVPLRHGALLEPVDRAADERSPAWVEESREQRPQARRRAEIPEQLTARCGMEERAEREAERACTAAISRTAASRARAALAAEAALEQPHVVAVERRPRSERPRAPADPGRRPRRGRSRRPRGRAPRRPPPLFEILSTLPARPSSRRNAWSRSLPRSEAVRGSRTVSAAIPRRLRP
jgi:hypothetical protein